MKNLVFVTAVFVLLGLGGTAHAWQPGWTTLDVPEAWGATSTYAYGISGSNIVGSYYVGEYIGYSGFHSFLYDGSTWTNLDVPWSGATCTLAYGIDGANIVGSYTDASGRDRGFLYDGSTWTMLNAPGAIGTGAFDIDGVNIVGYYDGHGFLYDGSIWTTLDAPMADNGTVAWGIDDNNIVGYFNSAGSQGFLFNGSTWTKLAMPEAASNGVSTFSSGISGGNIVGSYIDANVNIYHGFLYDGTTWTTLDAPGAIDGTSVWSIDGNNVVGGYNDASGHHSFVYVVPESGSLFGLSAGLFGLLGMFRSRRIEG